MRSQPPDDGAKFSTTARGSPKSQPDPACSPICDTLSGNRGSACRSSWLQRRWSVWRHLLKTSGYTLESVACLLKEPLHHSGSIVAVCDIVAKGGETVGLATLLHFGELPEIELLIFDCAPIIFGVVHREAGGQGAVRADDKPVLTGAATPVLAYAPHEALHVLQPGNGIDHFVALALLVNEPVKQIVHHRKIFRADVGIVFVEMLEMGLLHHGRFVDVEGKRNPVVVGDFHQLLDIFDVGSANICVEENGVAVAVLTPDEIVKVRAHMFESFWQARLLFDGINSEIDRGDSRIGEVVDHFRAQQASIGCEINPKILLCGVVNDFVHKIRTQKGLATGGSEHAARRGIKPVYGAARRILGHTLDAIVVGPAVMTIEIAFPFGEEISNDGLKISRQDT